MNSMRLIGMKSQIQVWTDFRLLDRLLGDFLCLVDHSNVWVIEYDSYIMTQIGQHQNDTTF